MGSNLNKSELGKEIIRRLEKLIELQKELFIVDYVNDPFSLLVAIILSQNTNDKNSIKALKNLYRETKIEPNKIIRIGIEKLSELIKPAGLYDQKAKSILNLAKKVLDDDTFFDKILNLPLEKARKTLISIPGIGKKTADVFLAIFGKRTIGVDTHAARIARRLGLAPEKGGYEAIRKSLLKAFTDVNDLDKAHRYLISLGRKWCRANKPLCQDCPLKDICNYYQKRVRG